MNNLFSSSWKRGGGGDRFSSSWKRGGAQPDEATQDALAEPGEGESFLQRAIAEQAGRGEVQGVVAEIQERHERSLLELQQVFNDMAVLVAAQGEQLDDIEGNVGRALSLVDRGREQLQVARGSARRARSSGPTSPSSSASSSCSSSSSSPS